MRRVAVCGLTLMLGAAHSGLGQSRADTPESVIRTYFRAVAEQRWRDAAQFVDTAFTERMRRHTIASAMEPERVVTVEEHMRNDPEMPREVAEYFVRRAEQSMRAYGNEISYQFAMVEDTGTLQQLSPLDAAARYVQAKDFRYTLWRSYRMAPGCADSTPDDEALHELTPRPEVLASVVRGDTAWIMYRDTSRMSSEVLRGPEIAAMRRVQGRWLVDLEHAPDRGSGALFAIECTKSDSAATRRP